MLSATASTSAGGPQSFDPAVAASSSAVSRPDRVDRDEAFVDRVGQQQRQQLHHAGHGDRGVALVAQLLGPGGGFDPGDVGQAVFAPAGQDVAAQQAAVEVLGPDRHIQGAHPVV
jgi:hypothetical protein